MLSVEDLKVYFFSDERVARAVDGVSYDVQKGETVCLVGESGCGKTVSALAIMRILPIPPGRIIGGRILFHGQNLLDLDPEEMQKVRGRRIAMIFQEPMTSLNPVFTIGDQIEEAILIHEKPDREELRQRCIQLLRDVGIPSPEERVKDYPHQLSGGQRQRVMIAMALSCQPKLLIADEPTTAIDVTIQAQLLELMRQVTRDSGTALLLITHNLGVIARYADRVNVMYAGRIVEKGIAKDIYEQPRHPYTVGLLKSVPRLDVAVKQRLVPIEGVPPDLGNLPKGCAFAERCTHLIDRCKEEMPFLVPVSNKHEVACWVDISSG